MNGIFSKYAGASGDQNRRVVLSKTAVDEGAAAGTRIGTLSLSGAPDATFHLVDDAQGRFALEGRDLVVGSGTLSRKDVPRPRILVVASDGERASADLIPLNVQSPLPPLSLPTGARVAVHGDSQSGFNNAQNTAGAPVADAAAPSLSYGAVEQLFAADPRFNFDTWFDAADRFKRNLAGANQGLFGDHMEWERPDWGYGILPRLGETLSRKGQIVILQGGTNTINSGDRTGQALPSNSAYVIAQLDACLRACRDAGPWVVLETLLPRGDWPAGDARHAALSEANAWIRLQAGREGVVGVWDSWDVLAPGGQLDASMFMEGAAGVHRNQKGAHASALTGAFSLASILGQAVTPGSVFEQNPTIANLFGESVGQLAGTTGSRVGATTTGTVATGCSLRMVRGTSTQVAAKETVAGALARQSITITPVSDGIASGYHQSDFSLPAVTAGLPEPGEWATAYLFVEIGDTSAVSHVVLTVRVQEGSTDRVTAPAMGANSSTYRAPGPGNRGYWIATKPFRMPTEARVDRIAMAANIIFSMTAPAPFTLKLSRPILRRTTDPRPAWSY